MPILAPHPSNWTFRAHPFVAHSTPMRNCLCAAVKTRAPRLLKARWSLLAALLAALPAAHASIPPPAHASVPLVIPLAVNGTGHLIVNGNANGHPVRFVVDTACPVTIIDAAFYPKLSPPGAEPSTVGRPLYLKSFGYRAAMSGSVADLRVGGRSLGRVPVGVTALDSVLGRGNPDAEGILGSDLLLRCHAIIDLKSGTLLLDPSSGQREALAQRVVREGYTTVAMTATNGFHLAVPCVLSNVPQRLVVDTGSPGTVVQRAVINPSELVRPSRVSYMRTLGGSTTVAWMPLQNWSIGDFPVDSAMVATGNFHGGIFTERTSNGGQVAGQLGLEPLAHWRALVDFGTRKIYLKPSARRPGSLRDTALVQRPLTGSVQSNVPVIQQPRQSKGR